MLHFNSFAILGEFFKKLYYYYLNLHFSDNGIQLLFTCVLATWIMFTMLDAPLSVFWLSFSLQFVKYW